MKSYSSKNRARRAVDDDEQFFIDNMFCPLIKEKCNPYCVCFHRPNIEKSSTVRGEWVVVDNVGCFNYMLMGD